MISLLFNSGMYRPSLILTVLMVAAGCSRNETLDPQLQSHLAAVYESAAITPEVQEKWVRSCALCHVAGEGGAPRTGHVADWQPRLQQGPAMLLQHTLEGLNTMPPLGYCMDCETEDFAAMIKLMTGDMH